MMLISLIKSYWEKISNINQDKYPKLVSDETCDVCVIGGGFTELAQPITLQKIMVVT